MSNLQEIDPRLREATSTTAYTQRPTSISATPLPHNPTIAPALQHHQYPPIPDGSHQPIYSHSPQSAGQSLYPHAPHSAGDVTDHDDGENGGNNDPKRPRACEACRGLKVRCEPDLNNPDGPCKRCNKANRNCVVTAPTRKRQKKTDSRVAELEKKIDALTASLKEQGKSGAPMAGSGSESGNNINATPSNPYQQVTNGGFASPYVARPDAARMYSNEWAALPKIVDFDMKKPTAPPMVMAGQKRKYLDTRDSFSDSHSTHSNQSYNPISKQHQIGTMVPQTPQTLQTTNKYTDVVDRGVVTAEMATKMFECYVEHMAPHLPAVVFPPGTPAAEVRKNKPILFLAILAASCSMNYPELQKPLTKEVMGIYADRIICNGEKTLEIIQAIHVSTLWYWPPEHFEELKFYQLIHIAAVMAIDIGMGRKNKSAKSKGPGLWKDNPWRRTPFPDPESIEARRSWLACYFLCCNASMGLRRPNLIRWSPFMDECVEALENSPEAAHSDKVLCQWIRSQHIAEEVGTQFSMDDPVANVSIADQKVQFALKGLERDLEKWTNQIPADVQSPTLKITKHVVNLYMHEVAMHVDHNVDEFKPPFSEASLRGAVQKPEPLTPHHIAALSTCLGSIDGIFETFLKLDAETVRCLPVANFVRVAYAVVILIKMYLSAATPNSELGTVIDKNNMKVEYYLDSLVEIFKAAAADEKSRPAAKFSMVLEMLNTWFHRLRDGKLPPTKLPAEGSTKLPTSSATNETDTPDLTPDASHTYQPRIQKSGYAANTPLHVLSEAATGNQGGSSSLPATPADWNQQQYANYDPAIMAQTQNLGNMVAGQIDPSLGMNLGYTMGDGFEQAMGMTLGLGDFANYFSDDAVFGGFMDSVGFGHGFDGS